MHEIDIWRYQVSESDYLAETNHPILSAKEKERADRFLNKVDRVRYVTVHRFLRNVLSQYIGTEPAVVQFKVVEYGKPAINLTGYEKPRVKLSPSASLRINSVEMRHIVEPQSQPLHFNLSYRGEHALLAVSRDSEPGIDIEQIRHIDDPESFCADYFAENERDIIRQANESQRKQMIFTFWAFKEAFIKALGIGFSRDLTQFDLSPFIHQPYNALPFDDNQIWTINKLAAPKGYVAAVAVRGKDIRLVERKNEINLRV